MLVAHFTLGLQSTKETIFHIFIPLHFDMHLSSDFLRAHYTAHLTWATLDWTLSSQCTSFLKLR